MAIARALWHLRKHSSSIETEKLPKMRDGWCEIESLYSAISPGTERLVMAGDVPQDLYGQMRCPYMGGEFPFPVKYGYSLVGEVVDGPKDSMGKQVHVLYPHQDRCIVRVDDIFFIPPEIPAERATLASNLETAVNAIWDSGVSMGDRVLVVGFGIVGSLISRLLSFIGGVEVEVADKNPGKVRLAGKMGFTADLPARVSDTFDMAFHTSGTGEGLQTAIDRVGFEGWIIELSWHGSRSATLQLGGTFHSQRKRIISSQVSTVASPQRSRWDVKRRRELVFTLLKRPEFDGHITASVPFEDLTTVFQKLVESPGEQLSYLVTYRT